MPATVVRGTEVHVIGDSTSLGVETLDNNDTAIYANPSFKDRLEYYLRFYQENVDVSVKGKVGELLARAPRMVKEDVITPVQTGGQTVGLRALVIMMGLNDLAAWVNKDKDDSFIKNKIKSALRSTVDKARGFDSSLPIIVVLQHKVKPNTTRDNYSKVNEYFYKAIERYTPYRNGLRDVARDYNNVYVVNAGSIRANAADRIYLTSNGYRDVANL